MMSCLKSGICFATFLAFSTHCHATIPQDDLARQVDQNNKLTSSLNLSTYQAGDEEEMSHHGAWGFLFGQQLEQSAENFEPGYHGHTLGFAVGKDWHITQGLKVGLGLRYDHTDLDVKNFMQYLRFSSTSGMLYAIYNDDDPYYFHLATSYGYNEYDAEREIYSFFGAGPYTLANTAHSDITARQFNAKLGGGYVWSVNDHLRITPEVSLYYAHLSQDDYAEFIGGTTNLRVPSITREALHLSGDIYMHYENTFDKVSVLPFIHAKIDHDFFDDDIEIVANHTNGGTAFISPGPKPSKTYYQVGVGYKAISYRNIIVLLEYDYGMKKDYRDHSGKLFVYTQW